jgi:hypothetical protein
MRSAEETNSSYTEVHRRITKVHRVNLDTPQWSSVTSLPTLPTLPTGRQAAGRRQAGLWNSV